ncbi:MAG TPA: ABC transporter permease [bacterium]|jgi:spermidine/putrescine transport system permease protein|nr:ABC transporter permease [bacterium]
MTAVSRGWSGRLLLLMTWAVVLLIFLPPTYLLLISLNPGLLPSLPALSNVSLKWYVELLSETRMLDALRASVIIALLTAVATTAIALLAALAHRRMAMRWQGPFFALVVFSIFVPGVIQGLALSVIFRVLGITYSHLTVVAGHLLWSLPFAFIVLLTSLSVLRHSLAEAAHDLGAGEWQVFRDITFPIIRPGVASAALFAFLLSFNEFIRAFFLVGGQDTLPIYMFGVMNAGTSPTIYALAGSILLISFIGFALALYGLGLVRARRQLRV